MILYASRDNKGRYIKIRQNIETRPPTTKPLTLEAQERKIDPSLGKNSRQAQIQSSQSTKLVLQSLEWTKEFSVLWEGDMNPNNNGKERERLAREAREAIDRSREEGERLRQEDERKVMQRNKH